MRLTMMLILMLALAGTLLAQGTKPPERLGVEAEAAGDELYNAGDRGGAATKYEEALGNFNDAVANGVPMDEEIARVKGKLFKSYYFSEQFQKAVDVQRWIVEHEPGSTKPIRTLAMIYAKNLGDVNQAIAELVAFDEKKPDFTVRKTIAGYYEDLGNAPKQIEWYQKAIELKQDANVIKKIAALYREMGDDANAVKAYEDYLATNPSESSKVKTYTNMGVLYEDMKNFPKAITAYENALKLKYDSKVAVKLMVLYYDQGNWDSSMAKVDLILRNKPGDETAIYYRALIKIKLNDKQGAIEDFRKLENSSQYGADAKNNIKALQG